MLTVYIEQEFQLLGYFTQKKYNVSFVVVGGVFLFCFLINQRNFTSYYNGIFQQ